MGHDTEIDTKIRGKIERICHLAGAHSAFFGSAGVVVPARLPSFEVLTMSGLNANDLPGSVGNPSQSGAGSLNPELDQPEADTPGAGTPRKKAIRYYHHLLFMRRQREKRFGTVFSQDRGWDLLLLLMIARLEARPITASEIFAVDEVHDVSVADLERQIGFGNVILIEGGEGLENCQIVLSDEVARHMVDLFRIASVQK